MAAVATVATVAAVAAVAAWRVYLWAFEPPAQPPALLRAVWSRIEHIKHILGRGRTGQKPGRAQSGKDGLGLG